MKNLNTTEEVMIIDRALFAISLLEKDPQKNNLETKIAVNYAKIEGLRYLEKNGELRSIGVEEKVHLEKNGYKSCFD